jgi:phospholipase D1/2
MRIAAFLAVFALGLAAWHWWPETPVSPQEVGARIAPYRHAWFALPVVVLAFVGLGLVMVPVVLLIAITGVAFGPLLGPLYAMAGCLASASTGFAIGRKMGLRRVKQLGGERITRVTKSLKRNGTLAVFLVRKIPAPFTLVNIVVGASTVRYRDFIVGTALGMIAVVVALAGFGHHFAGVLEDPSARGVASAALIVSIPLTVAWLVNRSVKKSRLAES